MDRSAVSADAISANPATKPMAHRTYDPKTHHRRSIRLRGYDYSQPGAYFLTICTQDRKCLFGDIVNGQMRLNHAGEIVAEEWRRTAAIRKEIQLDQWVVMPNHFHGILTITGPIVGAIHVRAIHESPLRQPQSPRHMTMAQRRNMTLSKLIGRFKMLSSKRINQSRNTPGARLWQRNYWEHIVRDEPELQRLREYIQNNPIRWEMDTLYSPARRHG